MEKYANPEDVDKFVKTLHIHKYKVMILIMHDCGLRATEMLTLRFENFDFKTNILRVKTLKQKRRKQVNGKKVLGEKIEVFREIPISERLRKSLEIHVTELLKEKEDVSTNEYVFKSQDKSTHYSYKSLWKFINVHKEKHIGFQNFHAHLFRHCFATNAMINEVPSAAVQKLLGHTSYSSTAIYSNAPTHALREMLNYRNKKTFYDKFKALIFGTKETAIYIPQDNKIFVGRTNEITKIVTLISQGTNVAILGSQGIGKSIILDKVTDELKANGQRVLVFDDVDNIKKTLISTLIYLYENDKNAVHKLIYGNLTSQETVVKLTRESVKNLTDQIKQLVNKKEYFLVIDDVSKATPKSIETLKQLQEHFTMLISAKEISINKSAMLWGYEIIKLQELSRIESFELIYKLSSDMKIDDSDTYKNHIFNQSNGNPQVIVHLIERYRQEPILNAEKIRDITHYGSMKEIDLTIFLLLAFVGLFAMKWIGKEIEQNFQLISGFAIIMLLLTRMFMKSSTRKLI